MSNRNICNTFFICLNFFTWGFHLYYLRNKGMITVYASITDNFLNYLPYEIVCLIKVIC